jgi:hypothetical protein
MSGRGNKAGSVTSDHGTTVELAADREKNPAGQPLTLLFFCNFEHCMRSSEVRLMPFGDAHGCALRGSRP